MPTVYGKDKNGKYIKWGGVPKKFYYTTKESLKKAKAKLQKMVAAIYASGYKE